MDQPNSGHGEDTADADQHRARTLRSSSRIASRRDTRISASPTAPMPASSHVRHLETWLSQNRQIELQRNFYSNYYLSRNRGSQLNANQNLPATTSTLSIPAPAAATSTTTTSTAIIERAPIAVVASAASATNSSASRPFSNRNDEAWSNLETLASAAAPQFVRIPVAFGEDGGDVEGEAEIVRINNSNAATQTQAPARVAPAEVNRIIASAPAVTAPPPTSNSNSSTTSPSLGLTMAPFHEYLRHLGAFLTFGRSNGPAFVIPHDGNGNIDIENPQNVDFEPLNFEALFGFSEGFFNNGLTKQEINRHTISYEYKASLPAKRKRIKTEDGEVPVTAPNNGPVENCSICLDKFNINVQVRRLPCLHVFHIKCIDKWLKRNKKCPICRIAITINYDTLMSSLESGSTIDQCLSQQETSRPAFRPTITVSLQSGVTVSGHFTATLELNPNNSSSSVSASSASATTTGSNPRPTGSN